MKALILAAGIGSRLAPLTDNCPKSLVEINGEAILVKQLKNLYENDVKDITIISGYKADVLEKTVRKKFPDVKIICSVDYLTTNNMYSSYLAKSDMDGEGFLMMNADVFFDASVIRALLDFDASNAIVTDIGKFYEESMKVVERNGKLIRISKNIKEDEALGVSIDVYKFSAEGAKLFFDKCTEYIEVKKELNLWSEVALNDILSDIDFKACPTDGRWIEIDNFEDLEAARMLFLN